MELLLLAVDRVVVLGSALVVALFAVAHASTRQVETPEHAAALDALDILSQVQFPPPDPLRMVEIDVHGNVLVPAAGVYAVVWGGGEIPADLRRVDTACVESFFDAARRRTTPITVICFADSALYDGPRGTNPKEP